MAEVSAQPTSASPLEILGTKRSLVYDAVVGVAELSPQACSIARFPVDFEACIYLHHLVAKKKDLTKEHNRKRLQGYIERSENPVVRQGLERVLESNRVDSQTLSETLPLILDRMDKGRTRIKNDCLKRLRQRGKGTLCIMGCDGVGKTSLANAFAESVLPQTKSSRGKRLYRSSVIYKLFVNIFRPVLPQEQFDEFFAFFG